MIGLERDTIRLEPHNPEWALLYERERARLGAALGDHVLDLQHVGSTAIPGIWAKPILDSAAAVAAYEAAAVCIAPLEALGYTYRGENGIPRRRYFVQRTPDGETTLVHLHMLEVHSAEWENHLLFRDYLRAHTVDAQAYQALKEGLMARYPHDRGAYTEGKEAFVARILVQARLQRASVAASARAAGLSEAEVEALIEEARKSI
jgi:GrpB-like predicted nucleotidyltransferase (UPF0157 family)